MGDEDDEEGSESESEEEELLPIEKKARKEDVRRAKEKADAAAEQLGDEHPGGGRLRA